MNGDLNKPIATPTPPPQKKKSNLAVILILLLLIGGFLTLSVLLQLKKPATKSPSASLSDTTLIATVNGQEVFLGDVKNVAREQYLESAINNQALKIALDTLIERMLLDIEAKKYGVTVTDQELQEVIGNESSQLATIKRYDILKEKLTPHLVRSRRAKTVGFWIAPENYGVAISAKAQSLMAKQRKDALPALSNIEKRFRDGQEPLSIAKAIIKEYPSLESIIAVNGYILTRTEDEELLTEPHAYAFDASRENLVFFKTLFELKPGQFALVRDTNTNAGGVVVHIIDSTDGSYDNYEAWLKEKRKELVRIQQNL